MLFDTNHAFSFSILFCVFIYLFITKIGIKPQDSMKEKETLWIFGYGSLVWKPGFAYKRSKVGHITGYKRRFWHGDEFHRGDKIKVRTACKSEGFPASRLF